MAKPAGPRIAAHLILGPREEPFLSAMLESISPVASTLIVNDNSSGTSPHAETLARSAFGTHEGRLVVDRSPFEGFAAARNVCLRLHCERDAGDWAAFIDADEVHGPGVREIARRLDRVPPEYDFVDAYTWHFFASFRYYTSIERRMMFFRYRPEVRWEGAVHERLIGLSGKRIALPYVYAHYGHTLAPRRHAEKGRQYSLLGAPGNVLREEELDSFDVVRYYMSVYPRMLRFRGTHPPEALPTLNHLEPILRPDHELTDRVVAAHGPALRIRNLLRKLNYEVRWRARRLDPRARRLVP